MPTPDRPLIALLRAPGGEPWTCAKARIEPIETSRAVDLGIDAASIREARRIRRPLVVTSPRAARWLSEQPDSVERGAVFCSGSRTARILESGGWTPLVPSSGSGGELTASLLLERSSGPNWIPPLYLCGRATAGTFERALDQAGRSYEALPVYELVGRTDPTAEELELLGACDAVAVMAPSCLRFLDAVPGELRQRLIQGIPSLAGPTTAKALRSYGWLDVREAAEPSCESLIPLLFQASNPECPT